MATPRRYHILAVKILQGLFVGIDGFQRAKELCWESFKGLQWLRRIEIVAPGAGTWAIQEFFADVKSLAIITILAPTKFPITVVVIVAYLCGVGGDTKEVRGGLPKACISKANSQ